MKKHSKSSLKKYKAALALGLAIKASVLTSCSGGGGGGGTTTASNPWTSYSVATLADLPTCAGDIISRLYYVEASDSFSVCKSTGWATLPISSRFVAGIQCYGSVSGLTGAAGTALNGSEVYYKAVVTAAGDVMSTATVMPLNGAFQVSGTNFYLQSQSGSATAPVVILADFATANYGFWNISVNRSNLVTTAVYTDTTLAGQSPVTMTFLTSACTAF